MAGAFKNARFLMAAPLFGLLPLAGYLWAEPGAHAMALLATYVAIILAGGLAIHTRLCSSITVPEAPPAPPASGRDEWRDTIRRLEQVIAKLSEPVELPRDARHVTLH